jgi:hypothetical protein
MPPSIGKAANEITVAETLTLLDSDYTAVAKAFNNRGFALWVGSGISFGRAPSLGTLICLVIEHLRTRLSTKDDADRFGRALKKILHMAGLEEADLATLAYDQPFETWPLKSAIVEGLWQKYSTMLDVRISEEDDDYLLWSAVDVRHEYGHVADPDSEHLAIAILVLEGAVSKIASANWDGLIEASIDQLSPSGRAGILQVIVDPQDVRDVQGQTVLVKFHGCAVLSVADPAAYRKFLTATKTQITDWPNVVSLEALRAEVRQIATNYRAMMVGLSLQDTNLQDTFSKARVALPWHWPFAPEAQWHVFCEDRLGEAQEAMLRVVYGAAYGSNQAEILTASLLRAYGKPALVALALHVVAEKLRTLLVRTTDRSLAPGEIGDLAEGLTELRNGVALLAPAPAHYKLWAPYLRDVIREWSRGMSIFRTGKIPPPGSLHYHTISPLPISALLGDQNVVDARLGELAVGIALLGRQATAKKVNLKSAASYELIYGALEGLGSWTGARPTQVYFAQGPATVVSLMEQGALDGDNIIVLHCDDTWRKMVRPFGRGSPKGGSPTNNVRHVSIPDLLAGASNLAELEQRFLEEVTL